MKKVIILLPILLIWITSFSQNNAQFISQTVPTLVEPGQSFQVILTYENTGNITWKSSTLHSLGSQNPQDNSTWGAGSGRIALSNDVTPGTQVTFTYSATAPSQEGFYIFQRKMVQDGVAWFGDFSPNVSILVKTASATPYIDPTTLNNKVMFGYQGWFGAAGDSSLVEEWRHYFANDDLDLPVIDFWPDLTEFDSDELYATGLILNNGSPANLPSAYNEKTVKRHMQWLSDYNLDGVFLQRFVNELADPRFKEFRNKVLNNVKAGTEQHGRVFAVMYDISSGANINRFDSLKQDWIDLVDAGITSSTNYLHHNGLPIISIWGIGFNHHGYNYSPAQAAALIDFLHNSPDPKYRATIMGGVPTNWRTRTGDSESHPDWQGVYESLDILSPWSVNRYNNNSTADGFRTQYLAPDNNYVNQLNSGGKDISYFPVVWPGFSWGNLEAFHGNPVNFNEVPRNGGDFYWRQAYNILDEGINMIYIAMFDEIDEGTAMFKCAPTQATVPNSNQFTSGQQFMSLDADGYNLPSDHYLKLADCTGRVLRGELALTVQQPDCYLSTGLLPILQTSNNEINIFNYDTWVKVEMLHKGIYSIEIFNVAGQKVLEQKIEITTKSIQQQVIDISSLEKGIYLFSVKYNNTKKVKKIIR